jgi:hypothetical protein
MSKPNLEQLVLIVVATVGAAVAFVARFGLVPEVVGPAVFALAAILALAVAAVSKLSGRAALLTIPALAAFMMSIVALVVILIHHQAYAPLALLNAAVSVVLVRAAIRFDGRARR